MNTWIALTKKEFRLGLPVFLMLSLLFTGIIAGGYFIGNYFGITEALLLTAFGFVITMHIFFLLFYLFYSLNYERKMLHLWLHHPMPVAGLVSSKIVTGIIYMGITFSVFIFLFYQTFENWYVFANFFEFDHFVSVMALTVFYLSFMLAFSFLFFWSIFLTFSQRMNDFLSFIAALLLFLFIAYWYQAFMDLSFMQTITDWGAVQVNDIFIGFEFTKDTFEAAASSDLSFLYIGQIVWDLMLAAIMFFIACYIIEKKVEV